MRISILKNASFGYDTECFRWFFIHSRFSVMNKKYTLLLAAALFFSWLPASTRALTINATYVNEPGGQTWTAERKAVIQQAINEWQTALPDSHTVNVTLDFTHAGTSNTYLGRWSCSYSLYQGTDIYPWTPNVTHTIDFNVDYFNTPTHTWWDPTPTTNNDLPPDGWDALSVARHEIGHMMGISNSTYWENFSTGQQFDKWGTHISGTTFDPGGLNVPLAASNNLSHLFDGGTTAGDLMVPVLSNNQRRAISATDLNMLHLAYGYTTVVPPPLPTSTTYTLSIAAAKTSMHAGDSITLTPKIINTGTGTADTLDFTDLGASAFTGLSGSKISGGPLANAGGYATNAGITFSTSSLGPIIITPTIATAINHTIGGNAAYGGASSVTVNVYSGQGYWNTATSGNWTDASNWKWTTGGGIPGIDGVLSAGDTATFDPPFANPTTVTLNRAVRLARLDLNPNISNFTIAPGTGGTLTLQAPSGEATVAVYSGNSTISAPVVLGGDLWIGSNPGTSIKFSGGISGAHILTVGIRAVTASRIQVDTLRIGNFPQPSAAVPEPSMFALLGLGAFGLIVLSCSKFLN
jgi:hypothetical protein